MKKYGGEKMNIAFARNEYANTKSNAMTSKAENYAAVKVALTKLLESMTALKSAESAEEREPFFEQSLQAQVQVVFDSVDKLWLIFCNSAYHNHLDLADKCPTFWLYFLHNCPCEIYYRHL